MRRLIKSRAFWAVAGLLCCAAFALFVVTLPKLYRATAVLELLPPKPINVSDLGKDASIRTSSPDLNTYLLMIKSRRIATEVLASFTSGEFAQMLATQAGKSAASPLGEVSFEARRGRPIQILILAIHANPDAAVIIANRYATEFLRFLRSLDGDSRKFAVNFLKQRIPEVELQLHSAQLRHDEATQTENPSKIRASELEVAILKEQLRQLNQRIIETEAAPLEDFPFRIAGLAVKADDLHWWERR